MFGFISFSLIKIVPATLAYIYFFVIFLIGVFIYFDNKNPAQTVAWLLILIALPLLGFVLYLILGGNIKKRRLFKKMSEKGGVIDWHMLVETQKERVKQNLLFYCDAHDDVKRKLVNLLLNNSQTPFTWNNKTEILTNGDQTFAAKKKAMEEAKNHIHLEYFIVKDDKLGNEIKDILIRKSKEGVKVRFIYDGFGGWGLGEKYFQDLRNAGVDIRPFLPIKIPFLNSEFNHRNHRKILIVDGKIGFLGGLNIGDEYVNKNPNYPFWRDTHIKIEGEAVYVLQNIFLKSWRFMTEEILQEKDYFPKQGRVGQELIQVVPSGPDFDWETIQQAYFTIITNAKENIFVTTPYLIPDESILMALKTAALSGIDVKIIVPGVPDKRFIYYATCSFFEELIQAGVKIYKYNKGFIHAKLLTVDSTVASIGTANFDSRSFLYNFEVNAFCFDEKTIKRLEEDFRNDLMDCEEVILSVLKKRPARARILEASARLISPLL
ncbi:MAG: cardiolipin synthase [Bacillota bacterium]